ncbi:hypothetical protein DP939_06400 [Spongiactinospora rosea]|uniref:Zinc finger CGNR domain-containing protein n=1 Tax=Spongiactinospora rosea TaxID=2248750 RepID=A0A366M4N1_9ACTN|nr:CGNR zinc finger domain-containing protein [Spongiactinospora rosea]RBQ20710.1 hypothetical protein DP939_06400 [Spongiactinospora rosea]
MVAIVQAHVFRPRDLVGGHVVIDLVNTVTARDATPIDWIDGYPRLLEWAALTGRFDPADLVALHDLAVAEPAAAARALARTRALREALHDVITALAGKDVPAPPQAVAQVERHWRRAVGGARLAVHGGAVRPRLSVETSGLEYLNHELTLRAVDLLGTLPPDRTRLCPGPRCGWFFIDRSRGNRRRWCDMATCGNAVKGRAHYQRKRQAARAPEDRQAT